MASSVIDIPLGTTAWQLQNYINNSSSGDILRLQSGNYYFDRTIYLNRHDITLSGAGRDETHIYLTNSGIESPVFQIGHDLHKPDVIATHTMARSAFQGERTVTLNGTGWMNEGDVLYFEMENTDEWIREIGGTAWTPWKYDRDSPLRTFAAEVVEINGNQVTLDSPLTFDFDPTITNVERRWYVDNVTLSGFNLYGPLAADRDHYYNRGDGHETYQHSMILAAGTQNLNISDIEIHDAMSHGITVADSIKADLTNLHFDGAFNKGVGGNGYSIWIRDVYDSSFTELTILDTRHAVLFASYTAASGNYVHVADTNRDINFHGGPDQFNTIIVDIMRADDASRDAPGKELFFNEGTNYGVPTDPEMNTVFIRSMMAEVETRLEVGRGGRIRLGGDEFFTGEGNDFAHAGGGNDTIYGSDGDDTIDGGLGNDILTLPGLVAEYDITHDLDGGLYFERGNKQTWVVNTEKITFRDASFSASDLIETSLQEKKPRDDPDGALAGAGQVSSNDGNDSGNDGGTDDDDSGDDGAGGDDPNSGTVPATHLGWLEMDTSELETPTSNNSWDTIWISASSLIEEPYENASMKDTSHYILVGNELENRLNGNTGHNRLEGRAGNDRLNGKDGNDTLLGGDGDDEIDGGSGNDMIDGGDGDDQIDGGAGNDTIRASSGEDEIDGEKGDDSIIFAHNTSEYELEMDDDDVYLLIRGDDETYIEDVEFFAFSDGTFTLAHMDQWAATGSAPSINPNDPDGPPPIFDFTLVAPL
jgi:Ca2+-binding RTX toxin-like protein